MFRLVVTALLLFGLTAPRAVDAQPANKTWRVGILATANPRVYDDVVDELRKLGYVDGQNIAVVRRSADGHAERLPALAAELVNAGVDVIVAAGGEAPVRAARQATTSVPIVIIAIEYDPLALGFAATLARPGGNVTGLFLQQIELTAKRMEILKATLPSLSRVAILWDRSAADQFKAADSAARSLGLQARSLELQNPAEQARGAFAMAARDHAGAVFVVTTSTFFRERVEIARASVDGRMPAAFARREFSEEGGLLSYGPDIPALYRRAAHYVDRILRGAHPRDLAMEQPTKFEFVINMKTARALGVAIPPAILLRADRVIE